MTLVRPAAKAARAALALIMHSARLLLEPACGVGVKGAARRRGRSGAKADLTCAELAPAAVEPVPALSRSPAAFPFGTAGVAGGVGGSGMSA